MEAGAASTGALLRINLRSGSKMGIHLSISGIFRFRRMIPLLHFCCACVESKRFTRHVTSRHVTGQHRHNVNTLLVSVRSVSTARYALDMSLGVTVPELDTDCPRRNSVRVETWAEKRYTKWPSTVHLWGSLSWVL